MQIEANVNILQRADYGRKDINIVGYIAPITVKYAIKTLQIRKTTNQDLRT